MVVTMDAGKRVAGDERLAARRKVGIDSLLDPLFKIHETPDSIWEAFESTAPPGEPKPPVAVRVAELDNIREIGYWGFSFTKGFRGLPMLCTNDVHIWVGPNATDEDIRFLIAHELGHAAMRSLYQDEEVQADGYYWVLKQTERLFKLYKEQTALDKVAKAA